MIVGSANDRTSFMTLLENHDVKQNPASSEKLRALGEVVLLYLVGLPFVILGLRYEDPVSMGARIFPVLGILATFLLTWFFVRKNGFTWRDFGLAKPTSWLKTLGLGVIATIVCLASVIFLNVVVSQLSDAQPDLRRFEDMRDNPMMLAVGIFSAWFVAAFPEEMINRGYMLTRLSIAFGDSRSVWVLCSVLTSALFGLGHYYQGPMGIVMTGSAGFLFCLVYMAVKRNLWVCIIAHGIIDTLAFVSIYLGAQS